MGVLALLRTTVVRYRQMGVLVERGWPMSVTTAAKSAAIPTSKTRIQYWRCQFCAMGHHLSCPRVVWHTTPKGPILWHCECGEGEHVGLYCTTCKHEGQFEINPDTWRCWDGYGCAARYQARREENPVWRMIHAARVHSAVVRKRKRQMQELASSGVDVLVDMSIEQLHDDLERIEAEQARKLRAERKLRRSPPKPTTGICECCGEATKGGRFLPGHDAKLVSVLRTKVKNGDVEAYEEMKRRGWLKKLPVALREGVQT